MKKIVCLLVALTVVLTFTNKVYSQCSNWGSNYPTGTFSTTSSSLTTVSTCVYGSEYSIYSVTSGQTYIWTTCGDTDFDTQLSLWNTAHTTNYAYNDNACGYQSTITWTATFTGTVHLLVSQYNCTSNTTCMTLSWACNTCGGGVPPTVQDCRGAIPLCFATYSNPNSYTGQGNYYNEIPDYAGANSDNNCPNNCLLDGELNDVWYTFTVATSGTVSFTITPNSSGDDYDWAVYNLTNATCETILNNNSSVQVSCNFCGTAGATGPTGGSTNTCQHGNSCTNYNAALNVTAGQIYVVNVSNFSSTQSGYTITFGGTAQIVDNTGPFLQAITSSPACGQSQITVRFNENIQCSTVQPGDFSITGPGGPYTCTAVSSTTCNSGGNYDRFFTLTVNPAFTAGGTYTVGLVANSVSDICNHPTGTQTLNFTVTGVTGTANVVQHVSCNGGNNGSASASGSGGTSPYTYQWSNGGSSSTISGLTAGTYTVTIRDAIGVCSSVHTVTITQPAVLTSTITGTNVACYGGSTGSATVSPSGGTPGYTYLWSNSQTGATATGLASGTYSVTITDSRGCTTTNTRTVTQATQINITMAGTNVSCNGGNNGTATATPSGGTPNYSYAWSNGGNSATISGLVANTYTVTVTDAAGCTRTNTVTITQPSILNATVAGTNASCNGGSNGTLTATPSGGTPAYTYYWFPSAQTSQTATGLAAGSYSVTVTDNRGCTKVVSGSVGQPAAMTLTPTSTSATCGMSNGSASVSVSGGISPYTYSWSTGGTSSSISGIPSGSYTVTVTDNNLCTKTASANVSNTGAPTLTISGSANVSCFGGNNGSASVSASGGTPGYTYSWSTGATSTSISSLTAGTYSATVTDAIGCQATNSVVITQPTQVISSITASANPGCFGASTGTATVSASGGTPGYTYAWSNGQTTANATGLAAGSYTVTVRDANNCSATSSVTLSQPSQVSANITANTPVSCFGGNNGAATVTASGGTPGYTYNWSNGNSNAANSGLIAGSYTVTVTDTRGCTATTSVLINQPANLLATIPSAGNVSCFGGSNGQAVSNVSGGTMPYTYSWSNSTSLSSITGVAAGTYTLTVTDNNLCTATASVTITEPTQLQASTSINNNVSCPGGNNGSASVAASGGTPVYFYSWSNGSSNTTVMGLPAGTHSVTVSDANMCTTTATVVISEPSPLVVNLVPDSVNCFGTSTGAINANPAGGTFPYTFLWSTGASTQNISGLSIGTYTVTMTDVNNCTSTQNITLYQPLNLSVTSTIADAHCGLSDGSIEITCSGGTPGYTYLWDAAAGSGTTNIASGIPSATYYVTVTDTQNCEYVHFFSVSDIGAPQVAYINQVNNVCFGDSTGTVTADITGGVSPYTITWSTGSNVATIIDLGAGTYYLTVTDNIGCETFTSVAITQPLQITAQVTGLDSITCYGLSNGSVTVQGQGGTPGYTYHWEDQSGTTVGTSNALTNIPAGQYYLTITDINNCTGLFSGNFVQPDELIVSVLEPTQPLCFGGNNGMAVAQATGGTVPYTFSWSNSVANDTTTGLSAGSYTVTTTDANGCTDTHTIAVGQPGQIVVTVTSANSTCSAANGEAYVSATGGTPSYTFNWSNGITNDTITGLSQGSYSVTVSDSNGCSQSGTVNVGSQNAGTIQVTLNTAVNCYGDADGVVTVSMNGGTSPYTYNWSHNPALNQPNATGLAAGSYSVTIVDANYCITDTTVTVSQPASAITALSVTQNILCYNFNNGMISVTASGGTSPYSYLWNNAATTSSISGLTPGIYTLTITDSHNCIFVLEDTITEPAEIVITQTINQPLCHNSATGSVTLLVTGGTQPITYMWNNGGTSFEITNLPAGQYMATITDQNTCAVPVIAVLFDPPAIQYTAEYDIDLATNNGYITIVATGGHQPYTYTWSNGAETSSLVNLPGGWYSMTLTDANGCFVIDSFYIDIPLIIPNMITPNKDGVNDDFEIQNIEAYESVSVEIYNRWGDVLFVFEGSGFEYKDPANRWKGTFNGKDLPMGSYVYIVKIEGKDDPYTGAVSIKR